MHVLLSAKSFTLTFVAYEFIIFFFAIEKYLLSLGIIKQRTLVCTNSPQNIYKINVIEPDCNKTLGYHSLLFYALYDEASSLQTQWQLI